MEDYQRLSALFQFYLDLVLKAFTFAIGAAGAVSAFVLEKDVKDKHVASFGLLLPSLLCIGMGVAFLRAVRSARELNHALQSLRTELDRRLAPHGNNLVVTLLWFGLLLVLSGISLGGLFVYLLCE